MKRSAMAQNIHVDAGKRSLLTDKQDNSKILTDVEAKTVKSASKVESKSENIYNQTSRKLKGVLSSKTPHIPTSKGRLSLNETSLKVFLLQKYQLLSNQLTLQILRKSLLLMVIMVISVRM